MSTSRSISLFFFFASLLIISCNKELTYDVGTTDTSDTTTTDTTIFIDVTIDGERTFGLQQLQEGNFYGPWYSIWGNGPKDTSLYGLNRPDVTFKQNVGNLIFTFSKGNIYLHAIKLSDNTPTPASYHTVDSFYSPGTYSYSQLNGDTTYTLPENPNKIFTKTLLSNGIHISWTDDIGTLWQTCAGSGDQAGSNFTITKNETGGNPATDISTGTTVTAVFNCKLYDNTGRVKLLTNGRFRLALWF